jgi:glyoxylase I family protein
MITSLHHVALIVSSEESLRFYELLGFTEIFRKLRTNDVVVLMEGHGIKLEIFIDSRHPVHPTGMEEPIGLRHFALTVTGNLDDEIEEVRVSFSSAGYDLEVGPIMEDWIGVRFCFVRDFDGLSLEIRENNRK